MTNCSSTSLFGPEAGREADIDSPTIHDFVLCRCEDSAVPVVGKLYGDVGGTARSFSMVLALENVERVVI